MKWNGGGGMGNVIMMMTSYWHVFTLYQQARLDIEEDGY
jgi:hypothetical protein